MAIRAERVRAMALPAMPRPLYLVSGSAWATDLAAGFRALAQGRLDEGQALRERAFDAAPETPGEIDGVRFDWIADADTRFGPTLEAIVNGQWGLIPFDRVERIESEGPRDLRDIVWLPASVAFRTGHSVNALLPVRYPGAEADGDNDVRLARSTGWRDEAWGQAGVGQHEWVLSGGESAGLLSLRRIVFD